LAWICVSATEVDSPFSVVEAATAAVPTPITAFAHPDSPIRESKRKIAVGTESVCRVDGMLVSLITDFFISSMCRVEIHRSRSFEGNNSAFYIRNLWLSQDL
jgi:hypothetical protein